METLSRINYPEALGNAQNFSDIERMLIDKLIQLKEEGALRIGFVSGRLRKDHMAEDSILMSSYAAALEKKYDMPIVFSSGIFFHDLWVKLPEPKLPEEERKRKFLGLFRQVLQSGYITDVYMLPDWREAPGAVDEYETALALGLNTYELGLLESI